MTSAAGKARNRRTFGGANIESGLGPNKGNVLERKLRIPLRSISESGCSCSEFDIHTPQESAADRDCWLGPPAAFHPLNSTSKCNTA